MASVLPVALAGLLCLFFDITTRPVQKIQGLLMMTADPLLRSMLPAMINPFVGPSAAHQDCNQGYVVGVSLPEQISP
jgi:hypothetical protein